MISYDIHVQSGEDAYKEVKIWDSGKRDFEGPSEHSEIGKPFSIPTKTMSTYVQKSYVCTITTVLALRQAVMNCIPGKR